ncbi:MAG: type II secretion system F family protein, partial [Eubacterium sp.]|nr:type II secretion system F family protein [Eubacterium sp.]
MKQFDQEYLSSFCLELSLTMHAGISVEDGLHLLSEDAGDKREKEILTAMADRLAEGIPLSTVVEEAGAFPAYLADMVKTGEETGRLEQTMRSLSDHYNRRLQLVDQIKGALMYPMILLVLMLVIIIVLLVKVLPIFNQVYERLGGSMTGIAQVFLTLGKVLDGCLPLICGVILGLALIFMGLMASHRVRTGLLNFYRKIRGNHGITRRVGEAQFASAMAMGMLSGLNTEESFKNAIKFQRSHGKVRERQEKCLEALESGESLAKAFRDHNILNKKHCRILELGVKSGNADTAMEEIARRMEEGVEKSLDRMVGRIEPTIVVITSILVGIILVAVMLP